MRTCTYLCFYSDGGYARDFLVNTEDLGWRKFLQTCWGTAFVKAQAPVKGVTLPNDKVQVILTDVFRRAGRLFDADSNHAEVAAFIVEHARVEALAKIAEERKLSKDHNRYRNSDVQSYDFGDNPDFDRLKTRDASGVLNSPELEWLFPALWPIAVGTFRKYGTSERDSEEVFSNCLQKLMMPRKSTGVAPLETLTIFEEVFPFFNKLVQNEAVNRIRQVAALKNKANVQESVEALAERLPSRRWSFSQIRHRNKWWPLRKTSSPSICVSRRMVNLWPAIAHVSSWLGAS